MGVVALILKLALFPLSNNTLSTLGCQAFYLKKKGDFFIFLLKNYNLLKEPQRAQRAQRKEERERMGMAGDFA
jgi:hypothetical protein